MWIFLNDAFLSVVADRANPRNLLVRARVEGDIERCFIAPVTYTPKRDYPYRASVPREQVSAVMQTRIDAIDYSNFKMSVADEDRHFAYLNVWTVMVAFQNRLKKMHQRWNWRRHAEA